MEERGVGIQLFKINLNLLRNNSNQQCDVSEIYSDNNYEKI